MQHYRFNTNHVWENFSGLVEYATKSNNSAGHFMSNQHRRIALNFALITLEAFMNQMYRKEKVDQLSPEDLYKDLRSSSLSYKLKNWSKSGYTSPEPEDFIAFLDAYKDVRDELTHPKGKDHSIYVQLEDLDLYMLVGSISEFLVLEYIAQNKSFPYWLLGWNYIGAANSPTDVELGNNGNYFFYSIRRLGCPLLPTMSSALNFGEEHLSSLDKFWKLRNWMYSLPFDTEPSYESPLGLPMSLLSRKWWDVKVVR